MNKAIADRGVSRPETEPPAHRLSDVLAALAETMDQERVDLATVIRCMGGERSIGVLLVFLALPMVLPVPAPGISVIFGIPLIIISAQLLIGRRHIWLPSRLARQSMSRNDFRSVVARSLPTLRRFESVIRPRLPWLAGDWTIVPIGLVCLVLAIIITLPIPLGHVLPGTAICLLALGLSERDGLAVGLGVAAAAVALAVVALASHGLVAWLHTLLA